jgi:uncharacterized protein YbjT (DUF2867 family)
MILVTGATGQVGREVIRHLGGSADVRALVRDRETAGDLGAAEIATGSFEDVASLVQAMDAVETLFLAGRDNPEQVAQHTRVLAAAKSAGVRHVVKLSALGASPASPVALMRWHHTVEEQLRGSSFRWTFLRPHLYMQNLLRFAGEVAGRGRLAAPMGARPYPFVDVRDVGTAAAAVVRAPTVHAGRAYALTGPRAVAYAELAERMGDVIGRRVGYDMVAPERFRADLVAAGVPPWRAADLAAIAAAYADADNAPSPDLESLIGRPATTIEQFLADHRDVFCAGASRGHA